MHCGVYMNPARIGNVERPDRRDDAGDGADVVLELMECRIGITRRDDGCTRLCWGRTMRASLAARQYVSSCFQV